MISAFTNSKNYVGWGHVIKNVFKILLLFITAFTLLSCSKSPKNVNGISYEGEIETPRGKMELSLLLNTKDQTAFVSSSLGLRDHPVRLIKMDADSLIFAIDGYQVRYSGIFTENDRIIEGVWGQGQSSVALNFEKTIQQEPISQDSRIYDFDEVEIKVESRAGTIISGTLTLPKDNTNETVVILLGVAGKTDRNMSFGPFKPFQTIAHRLSDQGFAVYRFDDPGVGESEGSLYESSYEDLITDINASIRYLQENYSDDIKKTGVLGISEGAALGAMMATDPTVSFAVLLSFPAMSGVHTIRRQIMDLSMIYDFDEQKQELLLDDFDSLASIVSNADPEILQAEIREYLENQDPLAKELSRYFLVPQDIDEAISIYSNKWYRSQLQYDPSRFLNSIQCPVLFLYGSNDPFVNPDFHIDSLKKHLNTSDNTITINKLYGINHIFQDADSGSPLEYLNNNSDFSERALNKIIEWLNNTTIEK